MAVRLTRLCIVTAAVLTAAATVAAAEQVQVKTRTYAISGKTGAELYQAMVRQGPRHGFVSRAIAQTSYTVEWQAEVVSQGSGCRVVRARPVLSITYTYPQPSRTMSADLSRRWQRFMAGVKKHEQKHGAIAREMVRAAEASVKGLKVPDDPACRKTRVEVKQRADKIYAAYEARQLKFDAREHRDGGNIDRLILGLVKGK
jgi:predicted secreted Zn-dependent protease